MYILITSIAIEDIFQMAINFDVVSTMMNSFSRGKNLNIIIVVSRILIVCYVILLLVVTDRFLNNMEADLTDPADPERRSIKEGLYQ